MVNMINAQHTGRRPLHIPSSCSSHWPPAKHAVRGSTIMLSEFTSCPVLITKNLFHQLIHPFIHAMGSYPKS
ncbi:hypothetical protein HanXRQr2_Chr17g0821481 [Helianthus annuus]|uniref:Uncharacterized protein n=1 Tax=Helianthus annuus TaxID=4232 RepID=A0A9K3GWK5_HELAN|nr:hypothetical protein HanXRQr2_Chr17g0821481 [Helianthus annuus]